MRPPGGTRRLPLKRAMDPGNFGWRCKHVCPGGKKRRIKTYEDIFIKDDKYEDNDQIIDVEQYL
eukprot:12885237-Prorocentrum_lima.AAC.1